MRKFDAPDLIVPHIGWNTLDVKKNSGGCSPTCRRRRRLYFVHSFRATPEPANKDWILATCDYGGEFVAAVQKDEVCACQFHPEKSGARGVGIFKNFLEGDVKETEEKVAESRRPSARTSVWLGA